MKLYGRNKFAAPCSVSGQWVEAGDGWRTKREGRWVTISSAVAVDRAIPTVLDKPNDRPGSCWHCGGRVDRLAGVLMVDHSGPHDVFCVMHRDCSQFMGGGVRR